MINVIYILQNKVNSMKLGSNTGICKRSSKQQTVLYNHENVGIYYTTKHFMVFFKRNRIKEITRKATAT
jgi:hypothetical protein